MVRDFCILDLRTADPATNDVREMFRGLAVTPKAFRRVVSSLLGVAMPFTTIGAVQAPSSKTKTSS